MIKAPRQYGRPRRNFSFLTLAAGVSLGWLATWTPLTAEPLTLRLNDAVGRPGEQVAMVIRTYAPRGIGQGQLCFRITQGNAAQSPADVLGNPSPLAQLEEVIVWSANGDAVFTGSFDEVSQEALVDFASASGGINLDDGAMAALIFRLNDTVTPGTQFEISLDAAASFLVDADQQPVPLEIRPGELEIVAPAASRLLSAEGDETPAGGIARLGIGTQEIFSITAGQLVFEYDPAVSQGAPLVSVDPRHGDGTLTVDTSQPGRLGIGVTSFDGSLNRVPGLFVRIDLPLRPDIPPGTLSPLRLNQDATWLEGPAGSYTLSLEDDVLEVVAPIVLFGDGFESGNLDGWSHSAP